MAAVRPTVLCTLPLPAPAPELIAPVAELRVLGRIPPAVELIRALGDGVDVLCPQLRDAVTAAVLEAGAPRLRAVCIYAVGYENIDVTAAIRQGVVVANTPGVLTDATADCAVGLIIAAARRLCEGDAELRAGRFTGWAPDYMLGMHLHGALLGIVGFGRIGQAVARRALGFSMRIAYTELESSSPPLPPDLAGRVERMSLGGLLAEADVISLHVPLTQQTRHLVDETALHQMKPTAILVNTSRGAVVDEAALVRALQQGWIGGAGLDVYEDEPRLAPGLAGCRNAVLAPHLGSATVATRAAMAELCASNALASLRGVLPPHCVNPEAWSTGAPRSLVGMAEVASSDQSDQA
jgi:glyoxylate reductase